MGDVHPAATTRVVTAGLSVAAALGIVAVLADDAEPDDAPGGDHAGAVQVVVPRGIDDQAAREAVRDWLDRDGAPPPAPQVLRDADRVDTTTRSS